MVSLMLCLGDSETEDYQHHMVLTSLRVLLTCLELSALVKKELNVLQQCLDWTKKMPNVLLKYLYLFTKKIWTGKKYKNVLLKCLYWLQGPNVLLIFGLV